MAVRTKNYPSSDVNEVDATTSAVVDSDSVHLIAGLTSKGKTFDPTRIYSVTQYLNTFGEPMNDAEFYVYAAVSNVIGNGGTPVVVRLPYDNNSSKVYNGVGIKFGTSFASSAISTNLSGDKNANLKNFVTAASEKGFTKFYPIDVKTFTVTNDEMAQITANGDFSDVDGISDCNFFVVDSNKSICTDADGRGGLFVVVFDPIRAMLYQRLLEGSAVSGNDDAVKTANFGLITSIHTLGTTSSEIDGWSMDLDGALMNVVNDSKVYAQQSLSRQIAGLFPSFDSSIVDNSVKVDGGYSNYIGIAVCKITKSDSLAYKNVPSIVESFVGCVAPRRNSITGVSEYIVDVVNGGSSYVRIMANRLNQTEPGTVSSPRLALPVVPGYDSMVFCRNVNDEDDPGAVKLTSFNYGSDDKKVSGATLGADLSIALSKVSNIDDVQIDVLVDAGLSSIAQFTNSPTGEYYQPNIDIDTSNGEIVNASSISTWTAIAGIEEQFCSGIRKDCMALVDIPRNATLNGSEPIINSLSASKNFVNNVEGGLSVASASLGSSYAAFYVNWVRMANPFTGSDVWVPPSCIVAGICAKCDTRFNPWESPAFLERGTVSGISGLSLYPSEQEEEFMYPKSLNYIKYFSSDGYVVWGQKTTQKKDGAFSRINVRRNALRIERHLYQVGRQFIGKGNTVYNRRRWIDIVEPYLSEIKNSDGIYDFMLVCDETNNTGAVIDANEFRATALIKFVREGEFVRTTVVATNTGADFNTVLASSNF